MIPGMPDIPDFKGLVTSGTDALISFGGAFLIRQLFGNQWGIVNEFGIPILLADTVESVRYENRSQVAQAPVERGSFASYNKVQDPYRATVVMALGSGSVAKRAAFIAQLETLSKSTLKFNVITPEYVHRNAVIVGYDYARTPQEGARMIVARIELEEIRESKATERVVETKNPDDSPEQETGEVQPKDANQSVLSKIYEGVTADGGLVDQAKTIGEKVLQGFDRFGGSLLGGAQ